MRKRTKRKHYAHVNPITTAIAGARVMDVACQNKLATMDMAALEAFQRGEPQRLDWEHMRWTIALAQVMCEDGYGPEHLPLLVRAAQALAAGWQRLQGHGRIGRAAGEYERMAEVCEVHALQRVCMSLSEYERRLVRMKNLVRGAVAQERRAVA